MQPNKPIIGEIKTAFLLSERVYKVKIGDDWLLSEVPKKSRLLIEKLGIEKTIT